MGRSSGNIFDTTRSTSEPGDTPSRTVLIARRPGWG